MKNKEIIDKIEFLAAEVDAIASNCDILTGVLEHEKASSEVYNAVFSTAKYLKRISDDLSNLAGEVIS